jgi:hypothetical protein
MYCAGLADALCVVVCSTSVDFEDAIAEKFLRLMPKLVEMHFLGLGFGHRTYTQQATIHLQWQGF